MVRSLVTRPIICTSLAMLCAAVGIYSYNISGTPRMARPKNGVRGSSPIWQPQILLTVPEEMLPAERVAAVVHTFLRAEPPQLVNWLHRWRLLAALPPSDRNQSVSELIEPVFSFATFRQHFPDSAGLIHPSPFGGWRVRKLAAGARIVKSDLVWHDDQLLATCAEVGVPLIQPIDTASGYTTLGELLASSRAEFVADQDCYWSLVAYASYLPWQNEWQNRFGEHHSYRDIARRMVEQEVDYGPCAGAHKLYALAYLLQLDEEGGFLGYSLRQDIETHLLHSSRALISSQLPNGAWHRGWAKAPAGQQEIPPEWQAIDRLVQVTGHHLEWLSLVPSRLRPSDESVQVAANFVLKALKMHGNENFLANYCGFSHGARALVLIKANELDQVISNWRSDPR